MEHVLARHLFRVRLSELRADSGMAGTPVSNRIRAYVRGQAASGQLRWESKQALYGLTNLSSLSLLEAVHEARVWRHQRL